jgi:hypothetical protein
MCDIKLANHGTVVYLYGQYAIMHNWATFGETPISSGDFEGFGKAMGMDFMKLNEVFGDKGSHCSRIYNSSGFNSFQTSFGNIGTRSSFHSLIACTSLTVTLEDTDVIPVFHIKNPL